MKPHLSVMFSWGDFCSQVIVVLFETATVLFDPEAMAGSAATF